MNRARQFFAEAMRQLNLAKPKKHRFQQAVELYLDRWAKFPGTSQPALEHGGIGVLITPWLQTPVPFFSLECARQLAASGQPVTIIWDSVDVFENASNAWEITQLERVIEKVRDEFPVVSPAVSAAENNAEPAFFAALLTENAVQKVRGEVGAQEFLVARPALQSGLRQHVENVRELLRARQFDWLLLPGGVWATSGVYACVAAELGLSVTTYDSGPGALFVGHDGVAAHFSDIAAVANGVAADTTGDPAERARMAGAARGQLEIRMRGDDEYRLQPVPASAGASAAWDVLVPLNLRWDSAALCRQRLFASVGDWLSQLLAWVEAHPPARVAIRQHPCEKLADFRGTDDFSQLLANYPRLGGRAVFISAQDPVNTYNLIAGAKVILPFTSRVGIEAAMLGKPVILAAECYYSACGFAWNPASAPEYFTALADALDGRLVVSEEARNKALITYYLAECCLELKTHFTPAPTDFAQWVAQPPARLWAVEENRDLLDAYLTREPLVSIRHHRLAGSSAGGPSAAARDACLANL